MKNFNFFFLSVFVLSFDLSSAQILSPVPQSIHQAQPSIYKIRSKNVDTNGTAFFVSPHLAITNFHGVGILDLESENFNDIELYQEDTLSPLKINRLVSISALFDLALLETSTPVDSYLTVNNLVPAITDDLFTTGYPHGILTTQQKTGSLLGWEHYYYFITNQSPFESTHGVSGSPVLNERGEVVGVNFSGIQNIIFAINPDKIEQLITNEIGTNCSSFDSIKNCIDNELNFVENEMHKGNELAQYVGIDLWSMHHKARLIHSMKQSLNNLTPEEQAVLSAKMNHEFYKLDTQKLHWHTLSAQQGFAPAQYTLGIHYTNNQTPDFPTAFYWMQQAAEQNFAPAQYLLSILYQDGHGTPKNKQQAINWLIQSAHQGYMPAQLRLAQAYSNGDGIKKNPLQAFQWYRKSAQEGSQIAQHIVAGYYTEGEITPQNWNLALYWMQQAAEQGYAPAQRELAIMYYNGEDGFPRDLKQAFYWTKQAAEQGDPESQFRLFTLYYNGEGTLKNSETGLQWLKAAAKNGHTQAQKVLAKYSNSSSSILKWIKKLFTEESVQ